MNEDDFYSAGMNEFQKMIQEYEEKFEQSKVEAAMMEGIHPITLGRRILRTETAGMTMLSILMFQLEQ
mgnify:CR=1 FL=1